VSSNLTPRIHRFFELPLHQKAVEQKPVKSRSKKELTLPTATNLFFNQQSEIIIWTRR
jgi:hypothetical protein